jgi:hypothetical protein
MAAVIGTGGIYAMPPYLARLNLGDGTGLMGGPDTLSACPKTKCKKPSERGA